MSFNFENFEIGAGRAFIISEIGNNHNGSFERAIEMVDKSKEMGADAVKFQMRHLSSLYRESTISKKSDDLGTEYILDLLSKFELSIDEQAKLMEHCKEKEILYFCTPWDHDSVEVLEKLKVPVYKVASADLTNLPLIDKLIKTQKPLILSTGMSTPEEVSITTDYIKERTNNFVLLHCNSTYPAPDQDINLNWMHRLKEMHDYIGYSGHERGIEISLASIALGACVLERHFTLDRNMEGPDHAASLEYDEFKNLISGVRRIESALGNSSKRKLSQGELINRENLAKSLVAKRQVEKGTVLVPEDIAVLGPGMGLSPQKYDDLLGKKIDRTLEKDDFFFLSDLDEDVIQPKDYKFKRPWGIPVRFHDFGQYQSLINPDFYEFHLSYSDMELEIKDFLKGEYVSGFVVHAPELFRGSHLMDLASKDREYRQQSILETQRVIDLTISMKNFFPKEEIPMIVLNVGGWSMDEPFKESEKQGYYERFAESLDILDTKGIELLPQTMAPFPWHFGGQRYQNIFLHAEEIREWCNKLKLRICFDISHSHLCCKHFRKDFYDFVEILAPITAHLHIGDAEGVNGEGLQIGDGEVDFRKLGAILEKGCPNAYFIPEIWQGHKDKGSGFWIALDKLENIL